MSMPKKVKIGTQVFQIVERSRSDDGMLNEGTFGYILDTENLIVIDATIASSRKKLTLFHEIMHAARMVYDTSVQPRKSDSFETWEHYFIGIWEESLLLVLKDNPELLEYIVKE
jgi:Zn-dependent peptidase ImmA (M78 family)